MSLTATVQGDLATFRFIAQNPRTHGSIHIAKVDGDTRRALPGASFNLTYWDEGDHTWKAYQPYSHTTDQNGKIQISGLPFGRYKIIEMQPPAGYRVETAYDKNELIFTISHNGIYADGEIAVANFRESDPDINLPGTSGSGSRNRYYARDQADDSSAAGTPSAEPDAPEAAGPLPAPEESSAFKMPTGNPGTGFANPTVRMGALLLTSTLFAAAVFLDKRGNKHD